MSVADVPLVTKLELDTAVLHVTYVTDRFSLTYVRWDRHSHQHAVSSLDIVVDSKCQLVVPETEVETQVGLL